MSESLPQLSYDDAEAVGEALHDHWQKLTGEAPIERGDLAWADMVQFVARKARERIEEGRREMSAMISGETQ